MGRIKPTETCLIVLGFLTPIAPGFAGVETWSSDGPYGVDVSVMAMDRAASVLLARGGFRLYRSADGGGSWSPIDLGLPDGSISNVVGAPGAFYFAEHRAGPASSANVFRSRDGGETWTRVLARLPARVRSFAITAVDPSNPERVFAGTFDEGILRSTDGGSTWTRVAEDLDPTLKLDRLWIAPGDPRHLFLHGMRLVPGPGDVSLLFRSTDGGDTWHEVDLGLPAGAFTLDDLAIDPESAAILYVSLFGAGLYRSTDGGASWQPLPADLAPACPGTLLRVHPVDTSKLYFVDECQGLYRSTDAGGSWSLRNGLAGFRVRLLLIDPSASEDLYVSTFAVEDSPLLDSVYRSSDDGATFTPAFDGIGPFELFDLELASSSRLYAVTLGQLLSSVDGGSRWDRAFRGSFFPTFDLALDPLGGALYLVVSRSTGGGIYRSLDGGAGWTSVSPDPDDLGPARAVAVDPVDPSHVYAGFAFGELYYSRDRGETWSPSGSAIGSSPEVLVVDPITRDVFVGAGASVYRSTDLGETWTSISAGRPPRGVSSLAVRGTTRYAGGFEGLSRWDEAGQSWIETRLGTHLGAEALALTPTGLYVGTRRGVFRSTDQGESFQPVDRDALGGPVHALAVDPGNPDRLFAGGENGLQEIEILPDLPVMSLQDGRFEVEVTWRDFRGDSGSGLVAVAPAESFGAGVELRSRDSAVAQFFGGDNWEVLVKVLDGTAVNGHYWVFFAAATNVGYTVTVTDTACRANRRYVNPPGVAAPSVTDNKAFVRCADPEPTSCVADDETFCLGPDGRFQVEMEWTDFLGRTGPGRQVRLATAGRAVGDDSGLFYFFTKRNWELMVKVLDGCGLNGHYWFFSAATTNVGYTVKVRDTATGAVRFYENRLGDSAAATTDTIAFPTCGAP